KKKRRSRDKSCHGLITERARRTKSVSYLCFPLISDKRSFLQKAVPSGGSNLARPGELGGKLLPNFAINRGRSEEEKGSAFLALLILSKLLRKIIFVKKIQAEALPSPSNVRSSPTSLYYTYILELNSVIYRERKKQKWDQARITHRVRVAKQAEQLRIDDNNCFKKDHFEVAIDAYTKAITLHPNVLMYWTNRALFHLKLSMIMEPTLCYCSCPVTRVKEDYHQAINLDSNLVKVYVINLLFSYSQGVLLLFPSALSSSLSQIGLRFRDCNHIVELVFVEFVSATYRLRSKKTTKGKGGKRFWKSIVVGFKTPRKAIEGDLFVFFSRCQGSLLLVFCVLLSDQC
ncbi:E3 ubiquitin-protein ligase CHIP, partial [Glycine soja]